jgi:hypothetical protein
MVLVNSTGFPHQRGTCTWSATNGQTYNLEALWLSNNQLSNFEARTFSGLTNLQVLLLNRSHALTELELIEAEFSRLNEFNVYGNVNITSVSLRSTALTQESLTVLLDGGDLE